jgi:hypothetical protein
MTMKPSEKTFAETLQQEHLELLGDLQQLEAAVRPEAGETPSGLGARLGKLQTHLADHFRFEEQDGYMAAILKEEPRFAPVVQELLGEHRQIAQTLDALIRELPTVQGLPAGFAERLRAWVKQVRHHEARENHLVQEAYYASGATGD